MIDVRTPDIIELPRGQELADLLTKVKGDPQGVRGIASAWRVCSFHPADTTSALIRSVNDVDLNWEGGSADAFNQYIRLYPTAGEQLNTAVRACAEALDNTAKAMEKAHAEIDALCKQAVTRAVAFLTDYLDKNRDKFQADALVAMRASAGMISLMDGNIQIALGHVAAAHEAVKAASTLLSTHVKTGAAGESAGFGFFTGIRAPGGADFVPGEEKVVWTRTPVQEQTQLSGSGGSGTGGDSAAGGGGAPAPKAEVAEWIKQALTIIKSPEMAGIMRERGIDVNDLDANDPQDVERIWTIIYHESGGNPNAINNWDINAKNGVPSQGLMQTIPPTFNAHALPGHGKILDPVDNIIAGVLYTYSRYGNLGGHPGISSLAQGGGYRPY
ncbi:transglycosylase SLT domain-containing protein [Nonomuraea rosea]|uniref:Transglycosylase SLT domain-containing protein n=1 Tax=Nonomuraea rosea TaxID=638574 RepID=A0ABP6ZQ80_9ACTN